MTQPAALDPAILAEGMEMAMAFGADWLKPIQPRLAARHPHLDAAALDAYNEECQRAMRDAQLRVPGFWNRADSHKEAFALWRHEVHARYPWITETNLSHAWSQGCYYAHKDGDLKPHDG